MATELKIPEVGESITEVEIGDWLKKEGDSVAKDENVVSIESEKATVELPAPNAGRISKILKRKGEVAKVGEVIGLLESNGQAPVETKKPAEEKPKTKAPAAKLENAPQKTVQPKVETKPVAKTAEKETKSADIGGRLRKETHTTTSPEASVAKAEDLKPISTEPGREEELIPMTLLRRTVAKHLVEAKQSMAMLTTFNEIDMSSVMSLRKEFSEKFLEKYGVKPGFMSFFVKACVDALKLVPQVNAEIRGNNIVYHNYFDIGVAIGGGKGLVVPVLRNAERMSFAEIEIAIGDLAKRAKENKLKPDELQGGTFTISNGGVYGSLLSTPIVNPPQSGILGMHTIQERPVAIEGQVVIRPMMYVALSYDHRIVDGREAVTFLKRVKEVIEKPTRMLLEV
jgi:2-oxoglutarate dehydrogenase E2 component (dihydrolipoamide succinyltransferase)